jgi:hypothetical protein
LVHFQTLNTSSWTWCRVALARLDVSENVLSPSTVVLLRKSSYWGSP